MDDNLIQAQGEKKLLELEDRQGSSSVNGVLSNGMCFVVDAYENRIRIISKEEQELNGERFVQLETLSPEDFSKFGNELPLENIDDDIDEYVNCDVCDRWFTFSCLEHPLYRCVDRSDKGYEETDERALKTLPSFLYLKKNSQIPNAGKGVYTKVGVPAGVIFGPYQGILRSDLSLSDLNGYSWEIRRGRDKTSCYIDGHEPQFSNWMRYINSSRFEAEQNLIAFQYYGSVFYRVYKTIERETELLVWYGGSYKFGSSSSSGGPNTTLSFKEQKKRKLTGKNPYVYY